YLNPEKAFLSGSEKISGEDAGLECLMNALRLNQGITVADFEARTGTTLEMVSTQVKLARQKGLLEAEGDLRATPLGRQYLNELLAMFLDD
ncbi:MAG: YggW family oxidoreductase, partial [Thalassolituus sp.]